VEIAGKHDPFLPPYVPALLVGELASPPSDDDDDDEEYVILLNKYSLVPEHILLVTKAHQSQQSPLYPPDLLAAYDLLFAAQRAGRPFFAFYNCGDRSGASQHHKHMQLMPCEQGDPPIEKLARAAKLETTGRSSLHLTSPYLTSHSHS
jgi:ATP adenylyltransferase